MTVRWRTLLVGTMALIATAGEARAEGKEVGFAEGFGLGYLPITVMVEEKMIETRARGAGLGDVRVVLHRHGRIKTMPASWKDPFRENIHDRPGS